MTKNKFTIDLNENNNESSDEDLTVSKQASTEISSTPDDADYNKKRMNKSGKPRAPYVLTDKRKQQFELARQVRMKNIEEAKAKQNENYSQYNELKKELEKKKVKKLEKIKKKELVKLLAETENISSDDDSDATPPQTPPKLKRTKSKKPIVVESETETESSSDEDVKPIKKATKKKTITTTKKKPIQKEKPIEKEYTTPSFGIRYF
jgi:hypothetical protein